jgi:hypothetical protein
MVDEKNYENDALIMIQVRNSFYKRKCYLALGISVLSVIVIATLIWMVFYLVKTPTEPRYFITDKLGRLLPDIPLQIPNMSLDGVTAWAVEAVEAAYSYDYINYHEQLQHAQIYFSDYGWRNYMKGLKDSGNMVALSERKMAIVAKVVGKPKLLVQGLMGQTYAWKFEIYLLATYYPAPYDEKSKFQNPLQLTVIVNRQNLLNSYKGLGIVQMTGNLIATPQSQELTAPEA